jgi:predicted nucleic acid-binding protein
MTATFLDSSAILRDLFGEANSWSGWKSLTAGYCSRLARLELKRTIDRERVTGHLDEEGVASALEYVKRFLDSVKVLDVTADLLDDAEAPLPTVVRSLDALHLVTALALQRKLGQAVLFVTHDGAQARCARAMGMRVEGVAITS